MPFTGFEFGRELLQEHNLNDVQIEGTKLGDHYDLINKKVMVLEDRLGKKSLTSITIICHEIAHAIARHGNERMSKALAAQMGSVALSVAVMNKRAETQEIFQEAYGITSGLGGLAFSRRNELESDKLGLVFMELAGYDATHASEFWRRMAENKKQIPEFLSTHPSDEKRIEKINDFLSSDEFQKHIQQ